MNILWQETIIPKGAVLIYHTCHNIPICFSYLLDIFHHFIASRRNLGELSLFCCTSRVVSLVCGLPYPHLPGAWYLFAQWWNWCKQCWETTKTMKGKER